MTMHLETKRLILRVPKLSDWKDIAEGIGDFEVSKTISAAPYPYKKSDALWWIKTKIRDWKKKKGDSREFVIELKAEKKVIGATGFHKIDWEIGSAESGSWIARRYWRQGFITEAKIAVNDWVFHTLKFQRVESCAFVMNTASNEMSRKYGYRFVGMLKRKIKSKSAGIVYDLNVYELLQEDWGKNRKKLVRKR